MAGKVSAIVHAVSEFLYMAGGAHACIHMYTWVVVMGVHPTQSR